MRALIFTILLLAASICLPAQSKLDTLFPVRGFSISAPDPEKVDAFVDFIKQELAPRQVNTLLLRVDYKYAYKSHPELRGKSVLEQADVDKIVAACKTAGIRIIPQINLLGHQSWHSTLEKLLEQYPQFDETPHIQLPAEYKWPNEDGLYCKSYCPLHPEVHKIVFDIVDEIIDAFQTDAFHAGMDEVFYLADDKCPRCSGRDPAELFAGEVSKIRNHLAEKGRELWIWGDRLIDGKTTGLGMWEASMNNTARAIDLIPKDVVICDWHYERADATAAYFAIKGFRVVTCPWRNPQVAQEQVALLYALWQGSTKTLKPRYAGVMQTIWSGADSFMDEFYGRATRENPRGLSQVECFKTLFNSVQALAK